MKFLKQYSEEEIKLISTIDICEAFFWKFHEHAAASTLKSNEEQRVLAVNTLKVKFQYTDEDIRQSWIDNCKDKWK